MGWDIISMFQIWLQFNYTSIEFKVWISDYIQYEIMGVMTGPYLIRLKVPGKLHYKGIWL